MEAGKFNAAAFGAQVDQALAGFDATAARAPENPGNMDAFVAAEMFCDRAGDQFGVASMNQAEIDKMIANHRETCTAGPDVCEAERIAGVPHVAFVGGVTLGPVDVPMSYAIDPDEAIRVAAHIVAASIRAMR